MPIETITKAGRKRYRWTFNRIIEGYGRVRQTKILPAGISLGEADKLARQWESEIYSTATGIRKPTITIGECVRQHVLDKSREWKDRRRHILTLEKWSTEYELQDATDLHDWSKQFVEYMRGSIDRSGAPKKPLNDSTIRNILAFLRAAIKHSYKVGLIMEDQTGRLIVPPISNDRHHYPRRGEMLQIARKCTNRQVRKAIRIAFYSGMRRQEILTSTIVKRGFSLAPDQTKNGRPRIVPIHPKIKVLARNLKFDIKISQFTNAWNRARIDAGYPQTRFHDLRHGAASEMINAGIDLHTVGTVLGHVSPMSTRRYAHLLIDRLDDAVRTIGKNRPK
jgi:integrase